MNTEVESLRKKGKRKGSVVKSGFAMEVASKDIAKSKKDIVSTGNGSKEKVTSKKAIPLKGIPMASKKEISSKQTIISKNGSSTISKEKNSSHQKRLPKNSDGLLESPKTLVERESQDICLSQKSLSNRNLESALLPLPLVDEVPLNAASKRLHTWKVPFSPIIHIASDPSFQATSTPSLRKKHLSSLRVDLVQKMIKEKKKVNTCADENKMQKTVDVNTKKHANVDILEVKTQLVPVDVKKAQKEVLERNIETKNPKEHRHGITTPTLKKAIHTETVDSFKPVHGSISKKRCYEPNLLIKADKNPPIQRKLLAAKKQTIAVGVYSSPPHSDWDDYNPDDDIQEHTKSLRNNSFADYDDLQKEFTQDIPHKSDGSNLPEEKQTLPSKQSKNSKAMPKEKGLSKNPPKKARTIPRTPPTSAKTSGKKSGSKAKKSESTLRKSESTVRKSENIPGKSESILKKSQSILKKSQSILENLKSTSERSKNTHRSKSARPNHIQSKHLQLPYTISTPHTDTETDPINLLGAPKYMFFRRKI